MFIQPKYHIAIYGPPGAGKSTIVLAAKSMEWNAMDLESVGVTFEERKVFIKTFGEHDRPWTVFGAADISPELFPRGTKFVLLAPDEDVLIARVQERNDVRTHKWIEHAKKVRGEHIKMAESGAFDLVVTENITPEETLRKIADTFQD